MRNRFPFKVVPVIIGDEGSKMCMLQENAEIVALVKLKFPHPWILC